MKTLDNRIIQNQELQNQLIDLLIDKMENVYERLESGELKANIKPGTYKLIYDKLRKIWHNLSNEELVLLIHLIKNQR